jgi:antirestriction protein ArdC
MSKWTRKNVTPRDHYQEVTDAIINSLENGVVPWRALWNGVACGLPMNATTGRTYRGINLLLLSLAQSVRFNSDPRWCSYRQAQARGWQVRRGERGTTVIFYKQLLKRYEFSQDGSQRFFPLLRSSTIFHASQIDGIPEYVAPELGSVPWQTPEAVDFLVKNSGVDLRFGGGQAFYSPSTDHVQMPPVESFESTEAYAKVLIHELGHWSYAKPRLDLSKGGRFGSAAYAAEEVRVEIASSMTCATLGIEPMVEHTAAYVENWLKALRNDKREIFHAAADAQRIADYLLAFHPDYAQAMASRDEADVDDNSEADGEALQEAA